MSKPLALLLALFLTSAAQATSPDLARAREHMRTQAWSSAIEVLEHATTERPGDAQAWYLLGYCLHAAGEYERALEAHTKAAKFPSTVVNATYNAACASALLGKDDEAIAWLKRAFAAGFSNVAQVQGDADLASLHDDPRFAALVPMPGSAVTFLQELRPSLELRGEAAGDQFGWIGRNAGDADGDGVTDILTSAPFKSIGGPNAGRVYVYSGRTGELLFQKDGQPGDTLGIGIESAGDVDGDGHADILAGAAGAAGTGAAFVWSGKTGALLYEWFGEGNGDSFGRKVAGVGDWNDDGHSDVIVGAPGFDGVGADSGKAYVFSGKDGDLLVALEGERQGIRFGSAVDGSCRADDRILVIGAQNDGAGGTGAVLVYRAAQGEDEPELGFRIDSRTDDVNLGRMFVSAVGDVDGDGRMDVYASDWESNANGLPGSGRIYVHSGASGELLHALAGEATGDGFGIGTAEAGDVDGDGCDDLLIGAWQNDEGAPGGGKCYLYSGKSGALLATYTCATAGETFGFDTTGLGDMDNDGKLEFLITNAYSWVAGRQSGRILVLEADLSTAPVQTRAAESPLR